MTSNKKSVVCLLYYCNIFLLKKQYHYAGRYLKKFKIDFELLIVFCDAQAYKLHPLCPPEKRQSIILSAFSLVGEKGLEPLRPYDHKILSLARLPVPPLARISDS